MYELYALFPFEQVEKNSNVIIYGAGRAGLNFVRQAGGSGYCNIVCMVDSDEKKHGLDVYGLERLLDTDTYDYVVISPINFAVRKRIRDDLTAYGVPKEKIVVPSDSNLLYWSLDGMLQHNINGVSVHEYDAIEMDARELVSARRLDIGIKWLLMRDMMNDVENEANLSLYSRHIFAWTGGREGFMPTSGYIRDGINEYLENARALVKDIKQNGFDINHAVPVSDKNEPLDGVHRISSCIEADMPIWVKRHPGLKPDIKDYRWYLDNGFSTEDMQRIYKAFCDLYKGSFAIVVLFAPAKDLWDFIIKQLENKFQLAGYTDLCFEDNYIAFENLINDMYFYKWEYGSREITDKISLLKLSELKMRVIVLSDEKCKGENLYGQLKDFKYALRDATFYDFMDIEAQIHSSDNEREAYHLSEVLLSPNNINYLRHRFKQNYRKDFIKSLVNFKKTIIEHNVPIENICIINSASMEVMGLRDSVEVDFICLEEELKELKELKELYRKAKRKEGVAELSCDFYSAEKARRMILDDNCHFNFFGLKFLNLEYVKEKKILNGRYKDKRDIRLIDLFNEMVMVYDKNAALKKGLYEETIKRRNI